MKYRGLMFFPHSDRYLTAWVQVVLLGRYTGKRKWRRD